MCAWMQAAAVPVAKVAAMEAAARAVEGENKRIQAELEEKTTELAELKTQVPSLRSFLREHCPSPCHTAVLLPLV